MLIVLLFLVAKVGKKSETTKLFREKYYKVI